MNNQNFFQRNQGLIWIGTGLLILSFFFRKLEFKNPFFGNKEKSDTAIISAINNNGNKVVDAINENGKKIDKLSDKVDKNTEAIEKGLAANGDSISSLKKSFISCREKSHQPKCGPNKKKVETPKPAQDTTKVVKPKPCPEPEIKPKPTPCPYDAIIDGEKYIYYNGAIPSSDNEKRAMRLKAGPKGSKDEGKWFVPGERVY